jgi:hypothetical protein
MSKIEFVSLLGVSFGFLFFCWGDKICGFAVGGFSGVIAGLGTTAGTLACGDVFGGAAVGVFGVTALGDGFGEAIVTGVANVVLATIFSIVGFVVSVEGFCKIRSNFRRDFSVFVATAWIRLIMARNVIENCIKCPLDAMSNKPEELLSKTCCNWM